MSWTMKLILQACNIVKATSQESSVFTRGVYHSKQENKKASSSFSVILWHAETSNIGSNMGISGHFPIKNKKPLLPPPIFQKPDLQELTRNMIYFLLGLMDLSQICQIILIYFQVPASVCCHVLNL